MKTRTALLLGLGAGLGLGAYAAFAAPDGVLQDAALRLARGAATPAGLILSGLIGLGGVAALLERRRALWEAHARREDRREAGWRARQEALEARWRARMAERIAAGAAAQVDRGPGAAGVGRSRRLVAETPRPTAVAARERAAVAAARNTHRSAL